MRKYLLVLISIAVGMLLVSNAMAYTGTYTPGIGINETPHDLGHDHNGMTGYTAIPADPLTRICIYCHAPHNAYKLSAANGGPGTGVGGGIEAPDMYDYLPLWNHELRTDADYQMYDPGPGAPESGSHAPQSVLLGMVPGSASMLCLSCHDGSIAINSYGNAWQRLESQSSGGATISNAYVIGKDDYLGNHHPIGFSYFDAWAEDLELRDPDLVQLTATTTVTDHLYGDARMECPTCHSVHNKGNDGEVLLWRSDQNSELCLTCHDKGTYTPF